MYVFGIQDFNFMFKLHTYIRQISIEIYLIAICPNGLLNTLKFHNRFKYDETAFFANANYNLKPT